MQLGYDLEMRTGLLQRWFRLQLSEKVTLVACAVVFFVLFLLPPLQYRYGRWNGFAAAQQDLEAGRLKLLRGGYRTERFRRLETIANQNYGIEIVKRLRSDGLWFGIRRSLQRTDAARTRSSLHRSFFGFIRIGCRTLGRITWRSYIDPPPPSPLLPSHTVRGSDRGMRVVGRVSLRRQMGIHARGDPNPLRCCRLETCRPDQA